MKMTNLITRLSMVAVGVVGLSSAGTLWAGCCHSTTRAQGTIQNVEAKAETFTMKNRHAAVLGIHWDQNTRFYEYGKPAVSSELKPGERVSVAYDKEGDKLVAKTIRVMPHQPAALGHARSVS